MKYIIFLAVLLSGCVGAGFGGEKGTDFTSLNPLEDDYCHVYIYRPPQFLMSSAYPNVTINGRPAQSVRNGSITLYKLSPGNHTFSFGSNRYWAVKNLKISLSAEKRTRRFYKLIPTKKNMKVRYPYYTSEFNIEYFKVSEEVALQEMKHLKLIIDI